MTGPTLPDRAPADIQDFDDLVAALRRLQDEVAGTRPAGKLSRRLAGQLWAIAEELADFRTDEVNQLWDRLGRTPGRGQAFVPVISIDSTSPDHVSAQVRFARAHLGAFGKAHGGALSLVFDDFLGRLANKGRAWAPTATLELSYVRPVPIEVDLAIEARVVEETPTSRVLRGTISLESVVLTEATGTWRVPRADRNLSLIHS